MTRVALAAVVLAGLALPAAAPGAVTYGPCPAPNSGGQCATVEVPLDREGRAPGTLGIGIERLPARGTSRGTAFVLAGGPGDAASFFFARNSAPVRALRATHDVVLVDQRGTGRSAPIDCPPDEGAAGCAAKLGAAVHSYTTAAFVEDLEAVRAALEVDKVVLYGISYGSYVAQAFARRHPDRVSALVLDAVLDQQDADDALFGYGFTALPGVVRSWCAGGRCRGFTRDPYADLVAVVGRLRAGRGIRGVAVDENGRARRGEANIVGLGAALLLADVNYWLRRELPAALALARRGDGTWLIRVGEAASLAVPYDPRNSSEGLSLAAACEDYEQAWARGTPVDEREAEARRRFGAAPADAFAPFGADIAYLALDPAACAPWPSLAQSPAVTGPLPDVPALLLTGGSDLRTPSAAARRVAALLPQARLLVVASAGHGVPGDEPCAGRAITAFLSGRAAPDCPRGAGSFRPLRPLRRAGGRRAAAIATARHAVNHALARDDTQRGIVDSDRFGGLLGGVVIRRGATVTLRRVVSVRGVRVSGRVNGDGRARLRVNRGREFVTTL
jgi:pimeloyl-ACP methyl ester carboxylesterase